MSKTIHVKPVETLSIELEDKTYVCYFNMLMIANMQTEFSRLNCKLTDIAPARMVSMILYSSINAGVGDKISRKEANALAIQMDPASYGTVMDMYFTSILDSSDAETQKQIKKTIAQALNSAMKSTTA